MTVKRKGIPAGQYLGTTTDTKPTHTLFVAGTIPDDVGPGATFYETDTGIMWIMGTADTWVEKDTIVRLETSPTINIGDVELITNDGDEVTDDIADAVKSLPVWTYGQPTLFAQGHSNAEWERAERTSVLATDQKSTTGWLAKLYAGTQSDYGDGAALYIPVNELPLTDLTSAQWTYWMENAEEFGCQVQIWVHDPTDNHKRADIIQSGAAVLLTKVSGWNGHILNLTTPAQFFWLGERVTLPNGSTAPVLTTGSTNLYSLAQFQADRVFSTWTIYRISLNNGFYNAGHFGDMYVADVKINEQVIPLKPSVEEQLEMVRDDQANALTTIPTWTFGEPTLIASQMGDAVWSRASATQSVSAYQKGSTGWLANLYGGVQTGGKSFGAVYVPVNELPLPDLSSALWTYWFTTAKAYGVNMVIWVHDPVDNDRRAEITQSGSTAGLDKAQYWNGHVLDTTANQFFWNGEDYGEGDHTLDGSGISPGRGTLSSWEDYQTDALFSSWTIYRISFEYGWYSTGTFDDAWVVDIKINGQTIPLKPDSGGSGRIGHRRLEVESGDVLLVLAPKTPFRLLSLSVKVDAVPADNKPFTATVDSLLIAGGSEAIADETNFDALILSEDMYDSSASSLFVKFGEGYDFGDTEEIDFAADNGTENNDYGVVVTYQTVF